MIIIKYILRNHLGPFLFAAFTLISVFLLQFLMKFADKLVGKGLDTWVIIQLILYNLAWMVVLVVPMAVLVATIMAFGAMSQNNEIAILKASGISLYKMILPPLFASIILALSLVYFNNKIYPDANHAARLLMEDITRKKPTLSLVPGVFSQEIPNYSILVRKIDESTNELKDITIYDYSYQPKINIVTAEQGKIYLARNNKKLMMDLYNGEIHETDNNDELLYRKLRFARHKIALPADQFTFEQSALGGPRGDRELGAPEMVNIVDSLKIIENEYQFNFNQQVDRILISPDLKETRISENNLFSNFIYNQVKQRISRDQYLINSNIQRLKYIKNDINRFMVEIHKKYSLPFACIVFILIGAPLGTMTRKAGFGIASGISLVFFLIYWAFLIGGEKLADRGLLSPFLGIWGANIVLGILGVLLIVKSAREKITLNFDFILKYIPKSWKSPEEADENS
ncbi:MAG: LptF/LptG family permease [Bacteroidota bacterium]